MKTFFVDPKCDEVDCECVLEPGPDGEVDPDDECEIIEETCQLAPKCRNGIFWYDAVGFLAAYVSGSKEQLTVFCPL